MGNNWEDKKRAVLAKQPWLVIVQLVSDTLLGKKSDEKHTNNEKWAFHGIFVCYQIKIT